MKGYWIIFGDAPNDAEAQLEYSRLWRPIAEKFDAKLKVLHPSALVESHTSSRALAVEFASYTQAKACYEDPAYQAAKEFALRAAKREVIIIEGDLA